MKQPLVSISCITYNHVNYIKQCLDGFLMQQCNFDYEILIHDDASTDGTSDIILEYQKKYPHIIKPIIQSQNQWSKGVRGINATFNFSRAQGKYIALCEGDDYWIDPLKLQKQVDFLEENYNFSFTSSNFKILNYNNEFKDRVTFIQEDRIINSNNYFKNWYFQPLTVMFRKEDLKYELFNKIEYKTDTTLGYTLLIEKKGYFFEDFFGVYRHHPNGIYSMVSNKNRIIHEFKTYYNLKLHFLNNKDLNKLYFKTLLNVLEYNINTGLSIFKIYKELCLNITSFYDFKQFFKKIFIR